MFPNDYFSPEDQGPEREEPEKTGPRRFFGLLLTESGALLKLNLLFLLTSIPLVTIPPAALALSRVVRGLLDDKPDKTIQSVCSSGTKRAGAPPPGSVPPPPRFPLIFGLFV